MKNNFKYTNNAKNFKKYFFELDFIETPEKCLNGVYPIIPSLNNGLEKIEAELNDIKKGQYKQNQLCLQQLNGDTISAIELSLSNFLENATICLVTSGDDGKTEIEVENIFAKQAQIKSVPPKTGIIVPELSGADPVKLGVYIPDTGTIMLWIDRIFQYSQPELLFQKVLLHELIHAMMDISPRSITNGKTVRFNSAYDSGKEECFDNTLVLYCYEWAISNNSFYNYVKDFIARQQAPYSDAIAEHDNILFTDFKKELADHLKSKLIPAKSSAPSTRYLYSLSYTIDNESELDSPKSFKELKELLDDILEYNSCEELHLSDTSITYFDLDDDFEFKVRFVYRENSKSSPIQLAIRYKDVLCLYDLCRDELCVVGVLSENEDEFKEWLVWIIQNLNPNTDEILIRSTLLKIKIIQHNSYCKQNMEDNQPKIAQEIPILTERAAKGNASAQFLLGLAYFEGSGVKKDIEKAIQLFTDAANQKHPKAMTMLGMCRLKGIGVTKDYADAVHFLSDAEKLGDQNAKYNMDNLFSTYRGGMFMLEEEEKKLRSEAENGDLQAQYNLGVCLILGCSVFRINKSEGKEWLNKAANAGHSKSRVILEDMNIGKTPNLIYIRCTATANPKFNRLQLRTDPLTFIELQPGDNYLIVDDYPGLEYGFSQIDDNDGPNAPTDISVIPDHNCQDVIEMDLSNFDGKKMTTMDSMFYRMENIKILNLENLDTSNVVSMKHAFCFTKLPLDFKFNLDTSKVKDMSSMFFICRANSLDLRGIDINNVEDMSQMFEGSDIKRLDLSGWEIPSGCNLDYFYDLPNIDDKNKLILRDCSDDTILRIAENSCIYNGKKVDGCRTYLVTEDIFELSDGKKITSGIEFSIEE